MQNNHSAKNMWGDYLDTHLEHAFAEAPKVLKFWDTEAQANTAVSLVKEGKKKAASHSLLGLQHRKESLPKIGDFMVLTDWEDRAQCIVRTTSVKLKPFFSVWLPIMCDWKVKAINHWNTGKKHIGTILPESWKLLNAFQKKA